MNRERLHREARAYGRRINLYHRWQAWLSGVDTNKAAEYAADAFAASVTPDMDFHAAKISAENELRQKLRQQGYGSVWITIALLILKLILENYFTERTT